MAGIILHTIEDTEKAARRLACCLQRHAAVRALLLRGPLGSGKTTFTAALVRSLPGCERAEVASPSFTICHHYPTTPPVLHGDLFRCQSSLPEEIIEGLDDKAVLTILEWAEHLPAADLPDEFLDISFKTDEHERLMTLAAHGHNAEKLLHNLCEDAQSHNDAFMQGACICAPLPTGRKHSDSTVA